MKQTPIVAHRRNVPLLLARLPHCRPSHGGRVLSQMLDCVFVLMFSVVMVDFQVKRFWCEEKAPSDPVEARRENEDRRQPLCGVDALYSLAVFRPYRKRTTMHLTLYSTWYLVDYSQI
jgi:hypothetical protein